MAEIVVSAVINQLVEIINESAKKKLLGVTGVNKEVRKLENHFKALQYFLKEDEERQMMSNGVKFWLGRLKNVGFDMEDLLDEGKTALSKLERDKS
ncbi:hypothetical protein PTKIN_Ptkin08bG0017200 [Pterospermum kingtungense]